MQLRRVTGEHQLMIVSTAGQFFRAATRTRMHQISGKPVATTTNRLGLQFWHPVSHEETSFAV